MSDQPPQIERSSQIEPQYLQAATQYAGQLDRLIWQKMALIFTVQSATIIAAYFLRGSLFSWITLFTGVLFCSGIVTSIHYDLNGRRSLLAQANHIGQQLLRLDGIVMSLEPYPDWSHTRNWTFWRIAILIAIDAFAACAFNLPSFSELANEYLPMPLLPSK